MDAAPRSRSAQPMSRRSALSNALSNALSTARCAPAVLVTAALLAAGTPDALLARPAAPRVLVHHVGAAAVSAVLVGPTAYVGIGPRLAVIDVSTPRTPRTLGLSEPAEVLLSEIVAAPGRVYAVDETLGLLIFDVTDPARPREVGRYQGRGEAGGAAAVGNTVLLADSVEGVMAVDLSNPAKPTFLGRWEAPGEGEPREIVAAGDRAYVTLKGDNDQLVALDISNPAKMTTLGEVQPPSVFMSALALSGNRLFLADGLGMTAIDVTDPRKMVVRGQFEAGAMERIAVEGDVVWCASQDGLWVIDVRTMAAPRMRLALPSESGARAVAVAGGVAVVADTAALQVMDVGSPLASPGGARIDLSAFPGVELSDLARFGDHLAVAAGGAGLRVYAVAKSGQPTAVGSLDGSPSGHHRTYTGALTVRGTTAYVAEDGLAGGLRIVDLTAPANPTQLGAIESPGLGHRPAVMGDHVLVPSTGADALGVRVFAVADPARPRDVAFVDLARPVPAVVVAADHAFAAGDDLTVIGLTDPAAPTVVATVPGLALSGLATDGRWLYGTGSTDGLVVVDAATPSRPRVAARLALPGGASDPRLDGSALFVATGAGGVLRVDVADPLHPTVTARWVTGEPAAGLTVDGDTAWVRGTAGIVQAIARTAPSAPHVVASIDQSGAVVEVAVDGGRLAALSGWDADHRHLTLLDGLDAPRTVGRSPLGRLTGFLTPGEDLSLVAGTAWVPGGPLGLSAYGVQDPLNVTRLTTTLPSPDEIPTLERSIVVGQHGFGLTPDGLFVFDVANPATPKILGEKRIADGFALAASADTVWVLAGDFDTTMLLAFDARTPRSLPPAGSWPVPGGAADLAYADGRLFLANSTDGLDIWTAAGPRDTKRLATLPFDDFPRAVTASGNRAWIALDAAPGFTVHAVDITDPAAPVDLGKTTVPDRQDIDLAAADGRAYVANALGGLYVLTFGEPPATTPTSTPAATTPIGPTPSAPTPSATTPSAATTTAPPRGETPTPGGTVDGGSGKVYLPISVRTFALP